MTSAFRRCLVLAGTLGLAPVASGQTTFSPDFRHVYAANFGWIDARAGEGVFGAVLGEFVCSGYLWSANVGWISLGDGAPADGVHYDNTTGLDSGVNHLGDGRLRGLAWSGNLGWIVFGDTGNPRVNLDTGELQGWGWAPNAGWIGLDTARVTHLAAGTDTDGDTIPDAWEWSLVSDLSTLGGGDADGDGMNDIDEYAADTDPMDANDQLVILVFEPQSAPGSTWVEWTSRPTRRYRLFTTEDLVDWSPAPAGWIVPGDGVSTGALSIHPETPRRFFRVESRRPLAGP